MLTLGVSVELVRRFVSKMSVQAMLSEERTTTIEQLLSNMTRATELTAELEAHSRSSARPVTNDFEEGGEEPEYIPISQRNANQSDLQEDGKKKFENLLKSKVMPRGFLTRMTLRNAARDRERDKALHSSFNRARRRRPKTRSRNGDDFSASDDDSEYSNTEERDDYIVKTLSGHKEPVLCVKTFGNFVVSGSCDGTVKLWDGFSTKCSFTFTGHTGWVNCMHLDKDKERLVTGSYDKGLKVWDLHKLSKVRSLVGHEGSICCLQGDLPTVASGSFDGTAKFWDIRSGSKSAQTLKGHTGPVVCLQYHDPKGLVLTGSRDATLKLWDLRMLKCMSTMTGHRDWIKCIYLDPSEAVAYSGSCDTTIKKWNLLTGQCELTMTKGRTGTINDICFLDQGNPNVAKLDKNPRKNTVIGTRSEGLNSQAGTGPQILVAGSSRGMLNVWNTNDGKCQQATKGHSDEVVQCQLFGGLGGNRVASCSYDGLLKLWHISAEQMRCIATLDGHTHRVNCLDASESRIVSGSWDRTIKIWELPLDYVT